MVDIYKLERRCMHYRNLGESDQLVEESLIMYMMQCVAFRRQVPVFNLAGKLSLMSTPNHHKVYHLVFQSKLYHITFMTSIMLKYVVHVMWISMTTGMCSKPVVLPTCSYHTSKCATCVIYVCYFQVYQSCNSYTCNNICVNTCHTDNT